MDRIIARIKCITVPAAWHGARKGDLGVGVGVGAGVGASDKR